MNFLITGATGFIGQNLVKRLVEDGHKCRCLVRESSVINSLKKLTNIELFYGDIAQKLTLTDICKGIDIVINSAGMLGKWNSTIENLRPVNANGINNLADEIVRNKVEYVIHLSAGGVTGPVKGQAADETYICRPRTPYEKTKWEGEKCALSLFEKLKVPIVVVRPTFTYGPGDPHKLPLFRTVKSGRFAFIGSGESTNHPVYVDDLVSGIILLLKKRAIGETFIIGGPRPITKKELIYVIAGELGVKKSFAHLPRWLATSGAIFMVLLARLLDFEPILSPSRVSAMADSWGYSIKKANTILGYTPKVDIKTGVRKTVQAYYNLGWL
ncbi:NAD-dependent epimerase/dehydratase family protein [Thermodesulfobacteriota bacterium]